MGNGKYTIPEISYCSGYLIGIIKSN